MIIFRSDDVAVWFDLAIADAGFAGAASAGLGGGAEVFAHASGLAPVFGHALTVQPSMLTEMLNDSVLSQLCQGN